MVQIIYKRSPETENIRSEVKSLRRVRLLVTPWTAADQVPPSLGFSRQEYWSGVPLPPPNGILLSHNKE